MENTEVVFTLLNTAAKLTRRLDSSLSVIKGISFSEYQLLSALRSHPAEAATRVDLATAVGLSPSGVTRALKPLQKLGFVTTVRDERDARKSMASLTAQGTELLQDADGVVNDSLESASALDALTPEAKAQFATVLSGLTED